MKVEHIYTKKEMEVIPWDGIMSMAHGRGWYSCPICGGGVTGPLKHGEPVMAHDFCINTLMKEGK